jgi:glycosyltransferase involved in cell wall biosynthesis
VSAWPSVGVVVPTRDRPEQLRAAVASVLGQDYPGVIRVVVVFDGTEAEHIVAGSDSVRVLSNTRKPGLAGARNTGILALGTDLVAFCDDDDEWLPSKLSRQVKALLATPGAEFASCGIVVNYEGRSTVRLVGGSRVTYSDLLRSRMVMVHSSTYLASRAALLDRIGLLDEEIPGGQNEDWDLALRAARRLPIVYVDAPLVTVTWAASSYFATQWESKAEGLQWMLARHPEIARSRVGAARVYSQIAFAYACLGRRREAIRWLRQTARTYPGERRAPFVLAVLTGLVSGDAVLRLLNHRGHGI